jgi:hypothetical protein
MDMLNLTLPLKQDPQSQAMLEQLVAGFGAQGQPVIDAAVRKSEIIHSARLLIIDNKYMQVLTTFDGDFFDYTEFFRQQLGPVFQVIFGMGLIENGPAWDEINTPDGWYEYTRQHNVRSLGDSISGNPDQGYLYAPFGETTVRELRDALTQAGKGDAYQEASPMPAGPPQGGPPQAGPPQGGPPQAGPPQGAPPQAAPPQAAPQAPSTAP